jgi:hypothetical protein
LSTGDSSAQRTIPKTILREGLDMAHQSLIGEFWEFLRIRKRFWLLPVVLLLSLLGMVIIFTEGSAVAPFIYALF